MSDAFFLCSQNFLGGEIESSSKDMIKLETLLELNFSQENEASILVNVFCEH